MVAPIENNGDVIYSRRKVQALLRKHKIDTMRWTTYTFDHLMEYHENDQFFFRNGNDPEGRLIIDIHATIVIPVHEWNRELLELYEEKIVFPNGNPIDRSKYNGVAETLKRCETPRSGILRLFVEELPFFNLLLCSDPQGPTTQTLPVRESDKWPGIYAAYHRNIFMMTVHRDDFDADGYTVPEERHVTYFKWRPHNKQLALAL